MDKSIVDAMNSALTKADEELSKARYLEESGSNAGIRKINATKAEWLSWVIYLASYGFERMLNDQKKTIAEAPRKHGSDFQKAIEFFKNVKNNF